MRQTKLTCYIKTDARPNVLTWCNKVLRFGGARLLTNIWSCTDCPECIEAVHAYCKARGIDPMKDRVP